MAKSLLAHLYTHIRGSQEDIATLSLQYILSQSVALNKSFTKRVADILHIETEETLQYATQVTDEERGRPGMVGVDGSGKETILCEMKFYAGLTDNQPLGYLDSIKKNKGKGLIFVCPESRRDTLWFELQKICEDDGRKIETIQKENCVKVDGISMGIVTWKQVIENLLNTAEASAEHLMADIKQLKGYCEQMDSEAFIPFKPEELTAVNAKKAKRLYTVIDKVTEMLLCDKSISANKNGLRFTPNGDGYISYIYVNDYALAICYDRYFWGSCDTKDTPFWLFVKKVVDGRWQQTVEIAKQMKKYPESVKAEYNSVIYLALNVPVYATEDEVCKSIKNQILNYIDEIDKGINCAE